MRQQFQNLRCKRLRGAWNSRGNLLKGICAAHANDWIRGLHAIDQDLYEQSILQGQSHNLVRLTYRAKIAASKLAKEWVHR
ncbi:MAG: hypothetical protein ACK5NE_08190 [Brachymonas sp.]